MFGRVLGVAVVRMIQGEPVRGRDERTFAVAVGAIHLAEVFVLMDCKVPAMTIPHLELVKGMRRNGRFGMPEHVKRDSGPLRTALAEDAEMQATGGNGCDSEDDTRFVGANEGMVESVKNLRAHGAVEMVGNGCVKGVVHQGFSFFICVRS